MATKTSAQASSSGSTSLLPRRPPTPSTCTRSRRRRTGTGSPLGLLLPESPRWLESHKREADADRIVSRWEAKISVRFGALPAPDADAHPVVQTEKVPAKELFQGRYRNRTILLLAVWILGYPGIVYGGLSYMPTYLVAHGWTAHQIFLWGGVGIITLPFVVLAFLGPLLISNLFVWTAANGYYGWILRVSPPCALVPSLLIGRFGMNQRGAALEQIST